jgi:hypothetical protein
MRDIHKRIVLIAFCDIGEGAATRRTVPAGRQAGCEASQESGGHAPGPFGISGISGSTEFSGLLDGALAVTGTGMGTGVDHRPSLH